MDLDKMPHSNQVPGSSVTANTAGLSNLWDAEHSEQKNILMSWGVWERPGGWQERSWVWAPKVPCQWRTALPTRVGKSLREGFSSSPWHYLFWICGCHILHGTWWMSVNSGKATEWPGGWKGSVPGVFTAQLDVALNAVLWAFCGRSDQTHLPPPVPSPLKYSVIQWLCWLINQDGLVYGGLSCIKVLLFCSFVWNHRRAPFHNFAVDFVMTSTCI